MCGHYVEPLNCTLYLNSSFAKTDNSDNCDFFLLFTPITINQADARWIRLHRNDRVEGIYEIELYLTLNRTN